MLPAAGELTESGAPAAAMLPADNTSPAMPADAAADDDVLWFALACGRLPLPVLGMRRLWQKQAASSTLGANATADATRASTLYTGFEVCLWFAGRSLIERLG
jgi:hypothetical protein